AVTGLVIGAAGDLGGRVVRALRTRGADVRGMARRPHEGCVLGDLADPASLDAACAGVSRMFLLSSPTREQVRLETHAIEAAERRSEEHTSELQSRSDLVCRLLLEKKKKITVPRHRRHVRH